ncbi:unnamed protein product [Penicillium roqueforti FM164]|uniref:Uncharacterized protein n=1 Tax=Penicillium roqueforti (strain FM164) TaxID=1365484 RepID=W6QSH4_PENRF|nr:unnamed protein product [Penicillium roqueforti FM164]
MEGQRLVTDPRRILINVTKTKLNNQSSQCGLLHEHLTEALDKTWMDHDDWHTTDWSQHAVGFIGQILNYHFDMNTFMGIRSLRAWPAFLRPFVHWFLPELRKCRQQMRLARLMLQPILDRRAHEQSRSIEPGEIEKFEDTIQWLE